MRRGDANQRLRRLSREISLTRDYIMRRIWSALVMPSALDLSRYVLQGMRLLLLRAHESLDQLPVKRGLRVGVD